jgi:endonuclease/exonuclease/phosphatase family metal-dependent hydrolase
VVYGLARDAEKTAFLQELHELSLVYAGLWLVTGDFNLIYHTQGKNNGLLNRHHMRQFRNFLNGATLKELHLEGRLFTWSNEWVHPTLERIDHAFHTMDWELLYPQCSMHSLAPSCSDHAPVLLRTDTSFIGHKGFLFRSFWNRCLGFLDVIKRA